MLGKLLKYELRATSRTMLPILGVMLLVSGLAHLAVRWSDRDDLPASLSIILAFLLMAFMLGLMALGIVTVFLMVMRFRNSLLRDEGYITHTLPVSVHAQIWSKALVSTLWYAAAILTIVLSIFVLAMDVDLIRALTGTLNEALHLFTDINNVEVLVEFLALLGLEGVTMSLMMYASLSVGHAAHSRKMLASVGVFIGFWIASQILSGVLAGFTEELGLFDSLGTRGFMEDWRMTCACIASGALLSGAVYYFITAWFLKNRLNLE